MVNSQRPGTHGAQRDEVGGRSSAFEMEQGIVPLFTQPPPSWLSSFALIGGRVRG